MNWWQCGEILNAFRVFSDLKVLYMVFLTDNPFTLQHISKSLIYRGEINKLGHIAKWFSLLHYEFAICLYSCTNLYLSARSLCKQHCLYLFINFRSQMIDVDDESTANFVQLNFYSDIYSGICKTKQLHFLIVDLYTLRHECRVLH